MIVPVGISRPFSWLYGIFLTSHNVCYVNIRILFRGEGSMINSFIIKMI